LISFGYSQKRGTVRQSEANKVHPQKPLPSPAGGKCPNLVASKTGGQSYRRSSINPHDGTYEEMIDAAGHDITSVTVPVAGAVAKACGVMLTTSKVRDRVARGHQLSRETKWCRCADVKNVRNPSL
jgi:hypothetical protein